MFFGETPQIESRALADSATTFPNWRLRHVRANINNEQRWQCARDKQSAPPENGKNDPVNQRGQEIPEGVALLQNSGEQTTRGRWQRFHRERCTQPPFAAHPDPE